MENNSEKKSKSDFKKPLIVYRFRTEEAHKNAITLIKFLIETNKVEYIYVENMDELNSKVVFGNNEKENYFKKFDENEDSNFCIILGGDGTILWANNLYKNKPRPYFISFNAGTLGFLSLYSFDKFKEILNLVYEKGEECFEPIKRSFVQCKVFKKHNKKEELSKIMENINNAKTVLDSSKNVKNKTISHSCFFGKCKEKKEINLSKDDFTEYDEYEEIDNFYALNEISIERDHSMLNMDIFLEGHKFTTISADGILFATTTGSTAYSLSAGGPILHNKIDGMIFNAICPFSMSLRPIVFPKGVKFIVRNTGKNRGIPSLLYDGFLKGKIENDMYLEITLSDKYFSYILLEKFRGDYNLVWIEKISSSLGFNRTIVNYG